MLGLTLDGASVNRSLVKLHQLQTDPIPYRTINPFAENNRYLYFFSDVPEKEGESGFFAHTLDAPLHAVIMGSTLYRAMHALLEEDTKILNTSASVAVHAMAESVCRWLITHPKETTSMEKKINSMLQKCMPKSRSLKQHQMWSCYHKLRISSEYATVRKQFLDGIAGENPAHFPKVYQYVGHFMFKEKVKSH